MSLTKAKLVDYLHKKMGLPKKDCLQVVETFFEEITLKGILAASQFPEFSRVTLYKSN